VIAKVALTILLSQYVRSRVDDTNPNSQCLWWVENKVIEFAQSADGTPENPGDAEFAAISKSIATWNAQLSSCSSLSILEKPHTATRQVGYFEKKTNENIAVFRLKKCSAAAPAGDACHGTADDCGNAFDCWQHQDGAIAITTTSYNPETGRILDSDIEYNVPSFLFTTVDAPPCLSGNYSLNCVTTDIENTTTHELGHLLGLAHITNATSTMNPRASAGETSKRVLDPGTADFVCKAYPKGLPSKTCLIKPVPLVLGKSAGGCSSAPALLPMLALLGLLRRRRA
jgi:Matrixin